MMIVTVGPLSVTCDSLQEAVALVLRLRRRGHDARIELYRFLLTSPGSLIRPVAR